MIGETEMKAVKTTVAVVVTLLLFFILFAGCIYFVIFNPGYLMSKYRTYDTAGQLSMNEADLRYVTEGLVDYVKGKADSLDMVVSVRGEEALFFNEKDVSHMKDVSDIIIFLRDTMVLAMLAVLLFGFFLIFNKSKKEFRTGVLIADGIIFVLALLTVIAANVNLNWLIVFAHGLVFNNMNWLLDPRYDNLIYLCPEQLFIDAGKTCGVIWIVFLILITVFAIILPRLQFSRPQASRREEK